jgi:hypothetical protein
VHKLLARRGNGAGGRTPAPKRPKLDEGKVLKLLNRRHAIERVVVAYGARRDLFWLARWLRERGGLTREAELARQPFPPLWQSLRMELPLALVPACFPLFARGLEGRGD